MRLKFFRKSASSANAACWPTVSSLFAMASRRRLISASISISKPLARSESVLRDAARRAEQRLEIRFRRGDGAVDLLDRAIGNGLLAMPHGQNAGAARNGQRVDLRLQRRRIE